MLRMLVLMMVATLGAHPSILVAAQTASPPLVANPTLQAVDASGAPRGWSLDGTAVEVASDPAVTRDGLNSLRVTFAKGAPYAGIVQRLRGDRVNGATVVIEGWLARDTATAAVGVWARAFDKEGRSIGYANSYELDLPADKRFRRHSIELRLPPETNTVLVGASIYGDSGMAWFGGVDASIKHDSDTR
ncbi:hypothetical protein [Silanimonas sp.]|uniref:hypothetical protein n=1 Tax=Silanimonas sp. TaxID=1929290 RepID=UPI0022BC231A|nr:hypothetical protein [Silanimonas sp.]MCZ8062333.1 hypothetical protein [Silanimonas sp.]